ncbi:Branched-chain-amino-acid aminotransferase, mitochondrial [Daldinia childiae]|uniref:Branched-chain-amino-acid aminotransferase, mitochondrial n=1 Tax=Daldinia childiae TaxID=326645 RepID=UPI001448795C|nr:Branched-chain-amino-acid aminotransferase, mitochondrial [Daldinia childiae]KAF3058130.1 Branched-chain-amino-acid aminotransferase, mitochondrial [Daldinia childiae]
MAPSAVVTSTAHDGEQDVNLTASAIIHQTSGQTAHSSNGHGNGVSQPNVQELNASNITYTFTKEPRDVPAPGVNSINDSTICTDHMVTVAWSAKSGWETPELKPYGPLSLMPTASVLHYATECFEGLKAYRGFDGKLRLFRPDCNATRFLMSSVRISLPSFPPAEVEKLLLALMSVDGPKWLPRDRPGSFIYLRPTLIGTQSQLGVQAPSEALLYIISSYMPVLDSPAGGLKLHTSPDDMVRAWVGGFGYAKVGANYGPSLLATKEARARGFGQILWLYGSEGYCTEAGASNFFVLWKTKEGKTQLVTAPLDDRLILDGVTRRSVLQLARERFGDEIEIVERRYTIKEVLEASTEGRLLESFAAGTAFFVCPISLIHHRGQDIQIPMGKAGEGGLYTLKLKGWLKDIMYGNEDHPWGVVVQEEH